MPEFESFVDVDVDDFVSACNKKEIEELIETLVDDGHLPASVINSVNVGVLESEFFEKIDMLKDKYYSLSREDEETMNNLFKKYL
jgi:hypothetical protein